MPIRAAVALAALMAFTYLGYPAILFLLSRLFARPVHKGGFQPRISVVLPVHDEGPRLAAKIANVLSQDYTPENVQIVVVDDGSTDGSIERLAPDVSGRVKLVTLPVRRGKASALNAGVEAATGDVVIFTDARQDLAAGAFKALAANFADRTVAAVTGRLSSSHEGVEGFFRRYEETLRRWEGGLGSCAGATGALYAIRRCAWHQLPEETILDDFVVSLAAARYGRLVYEKNASAIEAPEDGSRVWARRLRTLAGNWQLLLHAWRFRRAFSLRTTTQIVCHKTLRLLFPFFAAGFIASVILSDPFLGRACIIAVLAVTAIIVSCPEKRLRRRVAEVLANLFLAPLEALIRYLRGRETVLWVT